MQKIWQKIWQKNKCRFRVVYYLSQMYNGWNVVRVEDIDPLRFNAIIPKGMLGYEVRYGTVSSIYKSYAVYKGIIKSFEDIVQEFPNAKLCLKITEQMLQKGKDTKELEELFPETDLQQKFQKFVEECQKNQDAQDFQEKIGIVEIGKGHLRYVYIEDVIVQN